ncbi:MULTISPECIES: hypothetical protein [unclassified Amycolatopsis]|uniref:hypothetical protein n=1 Tax=unclassified Amycolatopsis TaxID=2618356 RepID=UPI0028754FE4|nr:MULTISPECIES: hypothetical protein [unclassified Amycolatopsis]MDS0134729.1 hypothetical protein [Amycolatopsis sp. 505]MDS0147372.1 hypothetical protein [Amycolatopsis sp. CM201R]
MSEVGAGQQFKAALTELRMRAGNPTAQAIVDRAGDAKPLRAKMNRSSLSDWFRGKSVPADRRVVEVLVSVLSDLAKGRGAPLSLEERSKILRLYRGAHAENQARRGNRNTQAGGIPEGEPLAAEDSVGLLSARFGNVCAFAGCRNPLMSNRVGDERFLGSVIQADRDSLDQRTVPAAEEKVNAESNVVLLCGRHGRELREGVTVKTMQQLQAMRDEALRTHAVGLRQHLPKLMSLNYANPVRLAQLALFHGQNVSLPSGGPPAGIVGMNQWLAAVLEAMSQVQLETRRLTLDFDLRTLNPGDLLVFDRQIRTLHGAMPNESRTLTGNLDIDPIAYFERSGVRVIMQLDPSLITTNSAFTDFGAGAVRLAGLCLIKRRMTPSEPPTTKRKSKLRFLASPLLLGIAKYDERDADISDRRVFEGYDPDTDETVWLGPWNMPRDQTTG